MSQESRATSAYERAIWRSQSADARQIMFATLPGTLADFRALAYPLPKNPGADATAENGANPFVSVCSHGGHSCHISIRSAIEYRNIFLIWKHNANLDTTCTHACGTHAAAVGSTHVDAARNNLMRIVGRRLDAIQAPTCLNLAAGQSWEEPAPDRFAGRHI